MIDFIYANGDSWTYGNGIDEDMKVVDMGYRVPLETHDRLDLTWAGHLGRHLNVRVKNGSMGGGSNARILRTTCDFLQRYPRDAYENLLVVIGWTTLERNEVYIDREGYNDYYAFNAAQPFSTQFPPGALTSDMKKFNNTVDAYQKDYITYIQNNKMNMTNYFLQLTLMRNLLENLGIKYMFFNVIPWHWLNEMERTIYELKLKEHASDKFLGSVTKETMTTFISDHNYPMSSCKHPMLDGHRAWGERIYTELKKVYPNDITD